MLFSIRINHTVILDDPFDDPPGLSIPDRSPEPTKEQLDVSICDSFLGKVGRKNLVNRSLLVAELAETGQNKNLSLILCESIGGWPSGRQKASK